MRNIKLIVALERKNQQVEKETSKLQNTNIHLQRTQHKKRPTTCEGTRERKQPGVEGWERGGGGGGGGGHRKVSSPSSKRAISESPTKNG